MTRPLTSGILAAVEGASAEFVHLIEIEFAAGSAHLCTGAQNLDWDSSTWEAVGGLLEFGGVEEGSDSRGSGVDFKLSGVDQTILAALLNSRYRGQSARIWRAHLNPTTGQLIDEPLLLFQGLQLSMYNVEEERDRAGGTVTISTRITSILGATRIRGMQANPVSHQHYYPGDLFFQYVAELAHRQILWGTGVAVYPRRPGGPSGPDEGGRGRLR